MKTYNAFFGKNATPATARVAIEELKRDTIQRTLNRSYHDTLEVNPDVPHNPFLDRQAAEEQEAGYVQW